MGNTLFLSSYATKNCGVYSQKYNGVKQDPPLKQLPPQYSTVKAESGKEFNIKIIDFVDENGTKMKSYKIADFNNDSKFDEESETYQVDYYKNRVGNCRCEGVIIDRYTEKNGVVKKKVLEFDKENNLLNKTITESSEISLFDVKNGITF